MGTVANDSITMETPSSSQPEEETCVICIENFVGKKRRQTECGHSFHPKCIGKWWSTCDTCPLCARECVEARHFKSAFAFAPASENFLYKVVSKTKYCSAPLHETELEPRDAEQESKATLWPGKIVVGVPVVDEAYVRVQVEADAGNFVYCFV